MSDAKLQTQNETAHFAAQTSAQEKKKGKGKIILVIALSVILAVGAGVASYFIHRSVNFVVTENARVTATLFYVMPPSFGTLERFPIRAGHTVRENETLGWMEGQPSMRAPADGIVVRTFAEQNQLVSPNEPVAVIADANNIHIQANIEETYIANLRVGQTVNVTIDALGRRRFTGYVYEIGLITDAAVTGQVMSFATTGRFVKVVQLLPVRINIIDTEEIDLVSIVGLNARVEIDLRSGASGATSGATSGADGTGGATLAGSLPQGRIQNAHGEAAVAADNTAGNFGNVIARGTVESANRRSVVTTLPHIVSRIYVQAGDRVSAGQIMAVLESDDLTLTVSHLTASNALESARVELQTREAHHASLALLYNAGSISQFELRQAEDALTHARGRYADAHTILNAAAVALGSQVVRSPIYGFVTAVFAREGAAGPGLLFVVEDTGNLIVRTRLREYDVARIVPGMAVEIRPYFVWGAENETAYTGIITRINPAAIKNELGETAFSGVAEFEAEVALTSQATSLRIGMNARLAVGLDQMPSPEAFAGF